MRQRQKMERYNEEIKRILATDPGLPLKIVPLDWFDVRIQQIRDKYHLDVYPAEPKSLDKPTRREDWKRAIERELEVEDGD